VDYADETVEPVGAPKARAVWAMQIWEPLTARFLKGWTAVVVEQLGIGLVFDSWDYTAVWGVKNRG
jgi:hypothetical protein